MLALKKISIFLFGLLTLVLLASACQVEAATLNLRSNSSSVSLPNIFNVEVSVNTQGKVINNAEGIITFPANLVSVKSISTNGSIFSLWVEQPSFSNKDGIISFNGGIPNPGYSGTSGKILTVVFQARAPGSAGVSLSSAAVRENDGLGTDIFTGNNTLLVKIVSPVVEPEPVKEEVVAPAPEPVKALPKPKELKPEVEAPSSVLETPTITYFPLEVKPKEDLESKSIGLRFRDNLILVISLVALLVLLIFILYYGWYRIYLLRHKYKKEVAKAERQIHLAFINLSTEARKQLDILEESKKKGKLSRKDRQAVRQLKLMIEEMDTFVNQKLEEIEEVE